MCASKAKSACQSSVKPIRTSYHLLVIGRLYSWSFLKLQLICQVLIKEVDGNPWEMLFQQLPPVVSAGSTQMQWKWQVMLFQVYVPSSLTRSVWWGIANLLAKPGELLKWQRSSCSFCFSLPSLESCLSLQSLSGGMEECWRSVPWHCVVWPDGRQRKFVITASGRLQMFIAFCVLQTGSVSLQVWLMQ